MPLLLTSTHPAELAICSAPLVRGAHRSSGDNRLEHLAVLAGGYAGCAFEQAAKKAPWIMSAAEPDMAPWRDFGRCGRLPARHRAAQGGPGQQTG